MIQSFNCGREEASWQVDINGIGSLTIRTVECVRHFVSLKGNLAQ